MKKMKKMKKEIIQLLILAKELLFSKRSQFIDKFGSRIAAIYTYTDMNLNYSWHSIFEQINQTALTKLEKELVSDIIEAGSLNEAVNESVPYNDVVLKCARCDIHSHYYINLKTELLSLFVNSSSTVLSV